MMATLEAPLYQIHQDTDTPDPRDVDTQKEGGSVEPVRYVLVILYLFPYGPRGLFFLSHC